MCGAVGQIERHHIVPRTDSRSTDSSENIASICGSCHNDIHAGQKIIEGRYITTCGIKLFWHSKGDKHIINEGIILHDSGIAEIRK